MEGQPLSLLDPLDARPYSTSGVFDARTFTEVRFLFLFSTKQEIQRALESIGELKFVGQLLDDQILFENFRTQILEPSQVF